MVAHAAYFSELFQRCVEHRVERAEFVDQPVRERVDVTLRDRVAQNKLKSVMIRKAVETVLTEASYREAARAVAAEMEAAPSTSTVLDELLQLAGARRR